MNSFRIELRKAHASDLAPCESELQYDSELDDISSILSEICALLERSNGPEFVISGFGQERWPVSHARELCLLLEQLPGVARSLQQGTDFPLEFVEQGCWRILQFSRAGDSLEVLCTSGDDWVPSPSKEILGVAAFKKMLAEVAANFIEMAEAACPQVTVHSWFVQWRESVEPLAV